MKTKIVSNPAILGGEPVVEGTRVPARNVLAEINSGASGAAIFHCYPSLPLDGIDACIDWVAEQHRTWSAPDEDGNDRAGMTRVYTGQRSDKNG